MHLLISARNAACWVKREAAARMSAAEGPLLVIVRREVQGQSTSKGMEKVSSAEQQQQRICSPLQLFREGLEAF